jgi:hypothetical protein
LHASVGVTLDPSVDPNSLSVADWNAQFIDPLISATINNVSNQPDATSVKEVIHHLLFTNSEIGESGLEDIVLTDNPTPHGMARCSSCTSAPAAKSACAAILGSGAVTFQ